MAIERRAVGDADKVGAERARLGLDLGRGQRLLDEATMSTLPACVGAGAIAASLRARCAFLNSCNWRATIPL